MTDAPVDSSASPVVIPAPPRPATVRGPDTVGLVAMIAGGVLFLLSITASVILGNIGAPYANHGPNGVQFQFYASDPNPTIRALAIASSIHVPLGSLVGAWVIVQGIVAIASNRGRRYGIVAIVVAVLAPIFSLVAYFLTISR